MIRASFTRFGGSKGVSTVIGTIFLVLVVFAISSNIFLYTMAQNTLYNQAVKESRQMDADRFSERVVASHANFTVPQNNTVLVDVTISNEGPLPAQIITIWVTCEDVKSYGFNDALDINLNPGDTVWREISVTVPGVQYSGVFSGWLVTARGNLVSLEKVRSYVQAQVSAGIGSIQMDFDNFRYYYWNKTAKLLHPTGGINSTNIILTGEDIIFEVLLTNFDNRTIALDSRSILWLYSPSKGARAAAEIVTVVKTNGNWTAEEGVYDPESGRLAHGVPTWVYFGPVSKSFLEGLKACAINLLLIGEIGSKNYGQNIPFVSVYVE